MTAEPVTLIPHVWVQKSAPGWPDILAGQVMISNGRQATYTERDGAGSKWTYRLPVRLAPRTQEGLDQLFDQLIADANRAMKGAA